MNNDAATKRAILIIASISSFLVPFMASSINVALPAIGNEFHIDAILLSWVPTSFLLATAMFLLPFGRVADIYGRKKIFLMGTIVYTLGSLISGLAISGTMLIACRLIAGVGGAMAFVTYLAILTSVYPREERGWAIGITTTAVYIGLSIGPFLGGLLTHHLGWRSIFFLNVPLGLIVIILVIGWLKGEWAEASGDTIDFPGSVLYALTLLLIMMGLSRLSSIEGVALLVAGVIGFVAFIMVEARVKSPVLEVGIFKTNHAFTFSNLAALIHYSATFTVTFFMSLYLQYIKGLNAQVAGIVLISQPVMMALFSPLAGRLSDRIEPRIIASLGLAITCLAIYLLSMIGNDTGLIRIVVNLLFLGFGFALFSSPNTNAVMSSVDKRHFGIASGTLGTMRVVGQMISMGLAMMIFSLIIGKAIITPDLYPQFLKSLKTVLALNGTLCFTGIFFSLWRGKIQHGGR
jgi:EmrB/QacA subfamily drug resistance transporter